MAKNDNSGFVRVSIKGKALVAAAEESQYKEWFECTSPLGLQAYATVDGPYFGPVTLNLIAAQGTGELIESFLTRGHQSINFETVNRNSDKFNKSYESLKVVYSDCVLHDIILTNNEEGVLCMSISFTPEEKVEVTLQVPDKDDGALTKVGPITYDIPKKTLV